MTGRPVQLVLDTSAVCAYPSINVREPIAEVNDEGAGFGIPVAALVAAAHLVGPDTVEPLIRHEAFVPLELTLDRWRQVGAALGTVGDLAAAHALIVADEVDCEILTARPDLYAGLGDDPPIIEL